MKFQHGFFVGDVSFFHQPGNPDSPIFLEVDDRDEPFRGMNLSYEDAEFIIKNLRQYIREGRKNV